MGLFARDFPGEKLRSHDGLRPMLLFVPPVVSPILRGCFRAVRPQPAGAAHQVAPINLGGIRRQSCCCSDLVPLLFRDCSDVVPLFFPGRFAVVPDWFLIRWSSVVGVGEMMGVEALQSFNAPKPLQSHRVLRR